MTFVLDPSLFIVSFIEICKKVVLSLPFLRDLVYIVLELLSYFQC